MKIWGLIITIGILFGPIIYLILSCIGDSISDRISSAKRKKFYGTEEIINISTYKSDITYEDLMDFFLSQIRFYKSTYYTINYKVYSEPNKQNYAWSVITNKEIFGWGEVYNIKICFTNGWVRFTTSSTQFTSGSELSHKYYFNGYDLGSNDIDRTLESCRQEAVMMWRKHGKEPNNNLPFDFYPMSTPKKKANSSKNTNGDNQREKTTYNDSNTSDMFSFYRNLLGLKLQFTQIELKEAYRKAVAKYHPDRYGNSDPRSLENAELLMKQVNEAYEILKKAA